MSADHKEHSGFIIGKGDTLKRGNLEGSLVSYFWPGSYNIYVSRARISNQNVFHWFHFIVLLIKYLPKTRELLTRSRICGRKPVFVQHLIEWYRCLLCCGIFFKILLWPWLQSHFQTYTCCCFCCLYLAAKIPFQKYLILFNFFKRILAPSFQLLQNLKKPGFPIWISDFRFCIQHQILLKKQLLALGFVNIAGWNSNCASLF